MILTMKLQICLGALLVATNLLVAQGQDPPAGMAHKQEKALTDDEKQNSVNNLKIEFITDPAEPADYTSKALIAFNSGVQEIAKEVAGSKDDLLTTVVSDTELLDMNKGFSVFFVTSVASKKIIDGKQLSARASDIKNKIDANAKTAGIKLNVVVTDGPTDAPTAGTTEGTTAGTTEGTTAGTTEGTTAGTTEGTTKTPADGPTGGLATWAIVMIVIAVLFVVGGAGFVLLRHFRR